MRPPVFADKCADPRLVRLFTLVKLVLLVLLIVLILLRPGAVDPPTLELPAVEVLSWPVLSGRGTAGSSVELISNGQSLGRAEVDGDGRWELAPQPPLAPAVYHLVARAVDETGAVVAAGPEGEGRLAVVGLPTLAVAAGQEEAGRVEPKLSGRGTPASRLRLVHNEAVLAPAVVDDAGQWAATVWVDRPSHNEFYLELAAGDDSVLGRSDRATVDVGPAAGPEPDGGTLADLTVETVRFDDPIRAETIGLIAGWLDVTGGGRPGRVLEIEREGSLAGQATIDPDGRWNLRFFVVLLPGDQSFTARMIEADGTPAGERSFVVAIPGPPSLAAEGGLTDAEEVVLSGQARPERLVTLLINGQPLATVESDERGKWQYPTRLQAGEYELLVLDGRLESERGRLTVALAVPVILGQPADESGQLVAGLYGLGRPETRLEVVEGERVVGQASVDAAGEWQCRCTLPPGEHSLWVREVDEPQRASQPARLPIANPSPAYVAGPADPAAPPFRCPEDSPAGTIQGSQYIIGCGESMSFITGRLGVTPE